MGAGGGVVWGAVQHALFKFNSSRAHRPESQERGLEGEETNRGRAQDAGMAFNRKTAENIGRTSPSTLTGTAA